MSPPSTRWDAARAASERRPPRRRVVPPPVGDPALNDSDADATACARCGYHECACEIVVGPRRPVRVRAEVVRARMLAREAALAGDDAMHVRRVDLPGPLGWARCDFCRRAQPWPGACRSCPVGWCASTRG